MTEISVKRFNDQRSLPTIAGTNLEEGTVLTIGALIEGSYKNDEGKNVASDKLDCTTDQAGLPVLGLSVRELARMSGQGGERVINVEAGEKMITLPETITVVKATPRTNAAGKPSFPAAAYKLADKFFSAEGLEGGYNALIEGGVKDDNTIPQLQNYTVSVG